MHIFNKLLAASWKISWVNLSILIVCLKHIRGCKLKVLMSCNVLRTFPHPTYLRMLAHVKVMRESTTTLQCQNQTLTYSNLQLQSTALVAV